MKRPEVVIVGAGIAGGALATVLARGGLDVLVLERTLEHKDVVRGEWIAPWGVAETRRLGLYDLYRSAGGHHLTRHVTYDELVPRAEAERRTLDISAMLPGQAGPLCLGHPRMCDLLDAAAVDAGARLLRGVSRVRVTPGSPPAIEFVHDEQLHTLTPRLVVGADGSNGVVAQQIGCTLQRDPEHHLFSGMLVEGAHDWPEDLQIVAVEGDVNVLAFPRGGGKVRVYMGFSSNQRGRLLGPDGPRRFLDAWRLDCVPHADAIVGATPVSPCLTYPNNDAWVDDPVRQGVVLIGDAAGRNDPITGQGQSITHRDVRLVSDALLHHADWDVAIFDDYRTERRERMRRLRTVARMSAVRESEFTDEARRRRAGIHERLAANPMLGVAFGAVFVGPEAIPAEAFEAPAVEAVMGGPIW
ncbi:MAG: FAD-dependent monooxygenase [Pseudomonadales bacterium]|nr:FAD-dependent monooxygenase [Pseudomonadales bacterium]